MFFICSFCFSFVYGLPFNGKPFFISNFALHFANNRTLRHVKNGVLCIMIYKPISVDAYGFTDESQTVVRIYTEGGGMITAKRCPTNKPLYCTRDGHFLSLTKLGLREVKPCFAVPRDPRVCHTRYPFMRQFGNRTCHMLMALTWIGPRPEGYEVDHINGDMLDWSTDNLEYVTPKENIKRAKLLRVLRSIGRDPKQMSREELLSIFSKYTFTNPKNID